MREFILDCPECGKRRSRINYIIDQVCEGCWNKVLLKRRRQKMIRELVVPWLVEVGLAIVLILGLLAVVR